MFWRQNAAQQQQQHQQQQQQQQKQQPPKRVNFSFNVNIAVNVHTKMSTTNINSHNDNNQQQQQQQQQREKQQQQTTHRSKLHLGKDTLASLRQQLARFGQQLSSFNSSHGGISTILIVNLLMLLLLSLCCDVCRSQGGHLQQPQFNYTEQSNRLPTLDSDVVEKVAVWRKHAAAAPPSMAEGIVISSIAGGEQTVTTKTTTAKTTELAAAVDERIALERVTRDCVQRCIVEEDLFLDEFGIKCEKADNSEKCYKTRCTKGCAQWYRALKEFEPCQEACSSTQFYPYDMPCIAACEMSQRDYWHIQRLAMTQLVQTTQPEIVRTPNTPHDELRMAQTAPLIIKWSIQFPENYLASRPFNIQYQYVEQQQAEQAQQADNDAADNWSNLADYDCDEVFACEILEALMPYTQYRFRFELPFGESSTDVLYSPASRIYQTPAEGAPISPPTISHLLCLDHSHISLHWQPGTFTNGPILQYRVTLSPVLQPQLQNSSREQLFSADRLSCVFDHLQQLTNYSIEVYMLNAQGESPAAVANIVTPARDYSPPAEQFHSVLLAGAYNVVLKSLEPAGDTRVVFQSDQLLSDVAWSQSEQRLWIVDVQGQVLSLLLQQTAALSKLQLQTNGTQLKPLKLSLDTLQPRLFLAAQLDNQSHALLSCDLKGGQLTYWLQQLSLPVEQLQLDALNGWLFWSDAAGLHRLSLANRQRLQLLPSVPLQRFDFDAPHWLLHVLPRQLPAQLQQLSYDGSYSANMPLAAGDWQSFAHDARAGALLLVNGSQLTRYNYVSYAVESWPLPAEPCCWALLPVYRQQQPLALLPGVPRQLRVLVGAQAAQISWLPPAQHAYQTAVAAQDWRYELEVLDVASQSAYNIRHIQTPYFGVGKLQPDNLYQLRVRASNAAGGVGSWTPALQTRTWTLGEHRLHWATANGQLWQTDELGQAATRLPPRLAAQPSALTLLNGSLAYYVSGAGELHCVNLLHVELNCSVAGSAQPVPQVGAVAYDWRGARLYWTDLARDCVVRLDPLSGQRELLPIFGARELALDAQQGHLYYTTVQRLARRTLSGRPARDELEYYHVNGLAARIAAFTLDLPQQHIYWLVDARHSAGAALRLYRAPLGVGAQQAQLLHTTLPGLDIRPHSMQHVPALAALLWLAADGRSALLARTAVPEQPMRLLAGALPKPLTAVQLREQAAAAAQAPDDSVVPQAVAPDSVRIDDGYWDDFQVRWQPVSTAEQHSVHYQLLLEYGARLQTLQLATPFVRITDMQQAQLSLRICITPHTAWRAGPSTCLRLATPAAAPSQPKRLRVFVQRQAGPLQAANISALVRWDMPEQALASGLAYRVYCWRGEQLHAERVYNQSGGLQQPLELRIEALQPDETYSFQVQSYVAATGLSAGAASATHAVHVTPEVQSLPRLVYATTEYIGELDLDTRAHRPLVHTASLVEHLALLQGEQRLLWVNENVELMTHVPGLPPAKLARMRAEVLALTVDWVQRVVYWAELDVETPQAAVIYSLQLCQFEGRILHGERLWRTPQGHLIRDLTVLPHAQVLLWLEHEQGARNATLEGRNLSNGATLRYKTATPLWRLYEGSLEPEAETVMLLDHAGRLCTYDVARQLCTTLRTHFNVLADDIAELTRDAGYFYALRNYSVRAYSRRKQQLEYLLDVPEARLLRAYNYQAYPPRRCQLLPPPTAALSSWAAPKCGEQQCSLQLPALHGADDCYLPVPGLRFAGNLTQQQPPSLRALPEQGSSLMNISQLQPYSEYALQLRVGSYYQQRLGLSALQLPELQLHTAPATPSAPRNFSVRVLGPSALQVNWLPPLQLRSARIWYVLHWQQPQQLDSGAELRLDAAPNATGQLLSGLQPDSSYEVWLQAHATPTKYNHSVRLSVRTYAALPPLQLLQVDADALTLSWAGTPDLLTALELRCQTGQQPRIEQQVLLNYTQMRLQGLQPKTRYECQLVLSYAGTPHAAPHEGPTTSFETLGAAPSAPGPPQIEHIAGEIYKVSWQAALGNGAVISVYNLQALQARQARRRRRRSAALQLLPWAEEPSVLQDQWLDFCNTTELSCIVRELHTQRLLLFRVRARSEEYGWGPYSEHSERVAEPFVTPEKRGSLVLAIIAPAAIVSSCVLALVLVRKVQKRRLRAKQLLAKSRPSIWSNLSTLQTQQQLIAARNRAFSLSSGPLSDADIALLPQISWSQLTLLRFLGSGAFGEVYEGQLQYADEPQPQRVAIKSLRKGASEFAELLQEAQLMSNFKHDNIVRLIGVCFDAESISLVMEYMQGGDLLSYLRDARPNTQQTVATLQLSELLTMCIDVAQGCSYLEDMHFVHRDLACRNCLVSSTDARRRKVKIGDFGLARDIYKSDYYRKEGEGLLPVRWMSPESLIDGVFTTQSDVWSFGVLCWEILTLGQQPYATRNNFEVLAYVKAGGRLQQPEQCSEQLYAMLLQCWRNDPEERPSFRRCVNTLQAIATDLRRAQMPISETAPAPATETETATVITTKTEATSSPTTSSAKSELKVRFDESDEQLSLHNVKTVPPEDYQLYENEGISRL